MSKFSWLLKKFKSPIIDISSKQHLNRASAISQILTIMVALNGYRSITAWINAMVGLEYCTNNNERNSGDFQSDGGQIDTRTI